MVVFTHLLLLKVLFEICHQIVKYGYKWSIYEELPMPTSDSDCLF